MFYNVLFLLTCVQLYKELKNFVKYSVVAKEGNNAEISTGAYVSAGMTALFYIMIMAICMMPSLLPSILW